MVNRGKDKGKIGKVLRVFRPKNRLLVEGLNLVKKTVKGTDDIKGGIFTKEAPIHYSRVNLIDPTTGKRTRVSTRFLEDGSKVRIAKRSGAIIPKPVSEYVKNVLPKRRQIQETASTTAKEAVLKRTFTPPSINELD